MNRKEGYRDARRPHVSVDKENPRNPILHKLDRWLVDNGIPQERVNTTTTRLQDFCSNHISQSLRCPVDLGVTVKKPAHGGVTVWLCILWPKQLSLKVLENNLRANDLIKTFADEVEIPLLPNPSIHLEYFLPEDVTPNSLKTTLRGLRSEGREYIGVFSVPSPHASQPSSLSTH